MRVGTIGLVLWVLAQAAPAQAQGDQTVPQLLGAGALALHAGILVAQVVYAIDGELLPPEGSAIELVLGAVDVILAVVVGALALDGAPALSVGFSVPVGATGGWLIGHGIAGLLRPARGSAIELRIQPTTAGLGVALGGAF